MFFLGTHLISSHFISFHLISSHFISFHLISSHFISFLSFRHAHVFESVPKTNQIEEINRTHLPNLAGDSEAVACTASADASIGAYTASRNAGIQVRVQTIPRIHWAGSDMENVTPSNPNFTILEKNPSKLQWSNQFTGKTVLCLASNSGGVYQNQTTFRMFLAHF